MAGVDERPGGEQQVDALGDDQLADEDHTRPLALREPVDRVGRGGGVAIPARARDPLDELAQARGQRLERDRALRRRHRGEEVRIHARRSEPDLGVGGRVVDRLAQALGDVAGADQDPGGAIAGLLRVGPEPVEVGEHGVGEVGAVNRERVAEPGAAEDHGAHDQVVGDRGVDTPERLDQLGDRRHVHLDVAVELGVGELAEGLHLEALVLVVDEDRQQAADVRGVDGHGARRPDPERGRVAVLADDVDLVPERRERVVRLAL